MDVARDAVPSAIDLIHVSTLVVVRREDNHQGVFALPSLPDPAHHRGKVDALLWMFGSHSERACMSRARTSWYIVTAARLRQYRLDEPAAKRRDATIAAVAPRGMLVQRAVLRCHCSMPRILGLLGVLLADGALPELATLARVGIPEGSE
jgi:hypothetical protein